MEVVEGVGAVADEAVSVARVAIVSGKAMG